LNSRRKLKIHKNHKDSKCLVGDSKRCGNTRPINIVVMIILSWKARTTDRK
jgi:ribosomal protein S17